jgi:hypothetical protein
MRELGIRTIFLSALLALGMAGAAFAQTGSIQGTVTDASGAVVEQAEIGVRSVGTNLTRTVTTSSTGTYSLTNLPVGVYQIDVKKDSFKIFHVAAVTLTVDQALTVNATLEPGAVSEEVQVRGDELPPVDLETSQVSNIVDSRKMVDLPLLTRDPYSLILLSPGTIQTNSGLGGFSVNGARERDNNFLLDGSDNNDTSVPGIAGGLVSLNPDATQEFRVITNNFMPEFGRNNGAIVDVVTKSGTNNWHGGARWFGRWDTLGARDYFNHNVDPVTGSMEKQNPYTRNQFGFNLGGPIIKNKTFFFYDMEWQRFRTTLTNASIVPSAAFKSALTGGTFPYIDYDPNDCGGASSCTFNLDLTSLNNELGLPYDPLIQQILALYPNPNAGAVDQTRGNLNYPSTSKFDATNITAKIDHHFNDRNILSIHGAYDWYKDPDAFHDEFLPNLGATATQAHTLLLGASLTSTLSPTLVNEAKFGFNKNDNPFSCGNLDVLNSFGEVDQYGRSRDFSLPSIAGFGCLPLGDSNGQWRRTGTWSAGDGLSWVRGAHTLKFGGDVRWVYEDGYDSFYSRDTVTFNGFTNFLFPFVSVNPALPPCDPVGYFGGPANPDDPYQNCGTTPNGGPDKVLQDMASMLYGIMDTESQSQFFGKGLNRTPDDSRQFRQHEYDFYVQDSWKVRPNLTLNFGLRYQFNGVPYEVNNLLSNLFENPSGVAPDSLDPSSPGCDPTSATCNAFTFSIVGPGTGKLLYNNDTTNWEPRIGFAWDPFGDGRTSVRGAFGIFHDRVFGNLFGNARGNPPFQQSPFSIPFDVPENVTLPASAPAVPYVVDGAGFYPVVIAKHFPLPQTSSWNLGIQREVLRDLTVEVNYVGNRGFHELRVIDGNPPQPNLVAANIASGTPPSLLQFSNLWFGGPGLQSTYNNAFYQAALNSSIGNSWYNGLQLNVNKRMSHGLQIQGAYTFAHAIDDSNDPLVPGEVTNRSFPRNSFELYNERGNSSYDIRHRLVINYSWELPFGRGRKYANSGFMGKALEGWQLAGITTIQSGHPYDLFGNVDSEHTGLSARLDLIGNPSLPAGHPKSQTGVNAIAFTFPDPNLGLPGNVSRNRFYGPGYNNWDMVMSKDTKITERVNLQFRTEVFNIFNRTQFDQPDNLLQDGELFGFSTQTVTRSDGTTSARQLQFGLKLLF